MKVRWPRQVWIVRHGESAGNVAWMNAMAAQSPHIAIESRDIDVPLSQNGIDQARALGGWFAGLPESERPNVALTSPYLRAKETITHIRDAGGLEDADVPLCMDERLREREFGALDRLTPHGIVEHFPDQAERRKFLGKFYYRPPSGESWCDVVLRLRSFLNTMNLHHADDRVLIVCHQVIVLCLRYLLESLNEEEILAIDAEGEVLNSSVTHYVQTPLTQKHGKLVLQGYNQVDHLRAAGTKVTAEPDPKVAAK